MGLEAANLRDEMMTKKKIGLAWNPESSKNILCQDTVLGDGVAGGQPGDYAIGRCISRTSFQACEEDEPLCLGAHLLDFVY